MMHFYISFVCVSFCCFCHHPLVFKSSYISHVGYFYSFIIQYSHVGCNRVVILKNWQFMKQNNKDYIQRFSLFYQSELNAIQNNRIMYKKIINSKLTNGSKSAQISDSTMRRNLPKLSSVLISWINLRNFSLKNISQTVKKLKNFVLFVSDMS